jgi:hypothetical protein
MGSSMGKMCRFVALVALMAPVLGGCSSSDDAVAPTATQQSPGLYVTDTAGEPVAGALIYGIPAADVEALSAVAISRSGTDTDTAYGTYSAEALTVDEPLEDLINGNFAGVAAYAAEDALLTDDNGYVALPAEVANDPGKYFIYVKPADTDTSHLPGGSLCREAVAVADYVGKVVNITVSTKPSDTASFVGSSSCLAAGCHADYVSLTQTAHKLGFMAPGAPSGLQDVAMFDDDDDEYNGGLALAKYGPGDATSGGTTIWFYDYDSTRSFDKFKTLESDPSADPAFTGTIYATVRIYSNGGKYYAQFTNLVNGADPNSPMTKEVVLTYGGGLYKQRPITMVDDNLFMVPLQFNSRGDEASADRVRKQWRDYHLDWWVASIDATPGSETMTFKTKPAAKVSVDVQCAPCHFNGYTSSDTGNADAGGVDHYFQATGVADANGETHPVLAENQELNIGCETCHGPGSEHVAANGMGVAIVTPQNLTPERETIICGQCHSRSQGQGTYKNDSPLDADNKMMVAGTSRADFLANNTSRHDSAKKDMHSDLEHSKAHHQQYTDFIQSSKYRNGTMLLTCASCHDLHAPGTDRHQLSGSSDGSLCLSCHVDVEIVAHQTAKTGANMGTITCIDCHNAKTANSGAGRNQTAAEGFTGASLKLYLHGDISSHRFDVPTKDKATLGSSMPVPYTSPNAANTGKCGLCHNTAGL